MKKQGEKTMKKLTTTVFAALFAMALTLPAMAQQTNPPAKGQTQTQDDTNKGKKGTSSSTNKNKKNKSNKKGKTSDNKSDTKTQK
jgi:hypothetical protein